MNDYGNSAFFAEFDAFVEARAKLRAAEEGSDDERYCIANCASQWNRVIAARESVRDATREQGS